MKPILHDLGETSRLTLASLLALALHGTLLFAVPTERWWQHPFERPPFEVILLPSLQRPSALVNDKPEKPTEPTADSAEHAVTPIAADVLPSPLLPTAPVPLPAPEFVVPSQPIAPTQSPLPAQTRPAAASRLALRPTPKIEPVDTSKARLAVRLPKKPIPSPEPTRPVSAKRLDVATKPPLRRPAEARTSRKSAEPERNELTPATVIQAAPRPDRETQAAATTRSAEPKKGRRPLDSSALLGQIASLETQSQRQAHAGVRAKRVSPNDSQSLEGFYIGSWVRKVEQIGAMNFPDIVRQLNLSAGPTLEVAIRADGSLQDVRVVRSSGNSELDRAAQRIVRLGAPYATFPPQLRQQYDVLYISRPWRFESSGRLRMR